MRKGIRNGKINVHELCCEKVKFLHLIAGQTIFQLKILN